MSNKQKEENLFAIGLPHQGTFRQELSHLFWRCELPEGYKPVYLGSKSTDIATSRNALVRSVMNDDRIEWLLQIDSDMGVDPSVPRRLVEVAEENDIRILSALTFVVKNGIPRPLLGTASEDEVTLNWIDKAGLIETSVGTGCLLTHRSVFEELDPPYFMQKYSEESPGIREEAEDYMFSKKAKEAGISSYVTADVVVDHHKTVSLQKYTNALSYAISCEDEEEFLRGI